MTTVEGAKQIIAQGPVASQEAIKQLGTNGGGFFNANSAHPFENPTPLSNLLAMFLIFVIPAALTYTFGKMVGDTRQGWAIFAAFSVMFLIGVFVCYHFEQAGNPILGEPGRPNRRDLGPIRRQHGRQGDPLRDRQLRAVRHGDHGRQLRRREQHARQLHAAGRPGPDVQHHDRRGDLRRRGRRLYGILLYCILAVFIAGLMVGRTPEYIGKKIEQKEVKMAMLAVIATAFSILVFTALSSVITFPAKGYWNPQGAATANMNNSGPHGLSEILYAYVSSTGNNGSAFAGITVNTPWYDLTLGLAS